MRLRFIRPRSSELVRDARVPEQISVLFQTENTTLCVCQTSHPARSYGLKTHPNTDGRKRMSKQKAHTHVCHIAKLVLSAAHVMNAHTTL